VPSPGTGRPVATAAHRRAQPEDAEGAEGRPKGEAENRSDKQIRIFVTGTDTGVGKTVVTACLAQAARRWGTVLAVKPVASGVAPGTAGEDADLLAAAAGHDARCFAAFAAPVSPHRAARLESRGLPPTLLADLRLLAADTVLLEGVGGWRVPLGAGLWTADLALTCDTVVVVAADRLGVLSHTLLTVDAIRQAGLPVAGVVLNRGASPEDASRPFNLDDLRELLDVPVAPLDGLDASDPTAREQAGARLLRAIVGRDEPF
jgi:dethiobiotin synthetase